MDLGPLTHKPALLPGVNIAARVLQSPERPRSKLVWWLRYTLWQGWILGQSPYERDMARFHHLRSGVIKR